MASASGPFRIRTPFMKKKKKSSKKNQKSPFSLRKIKIPGGGVK
jgi:hypothetical protein